MAAITLQTARQFIPMIYAYTTPEIQRHDGWTKIGYTEQTVEERLKQQTHTADVLYEEQWRGTAQYDDGSGEYFKDKDFHAYLRKIGIENSKENEWFHIGGRESQTHFYDFRLNHGRVPLPDVVTPYTLRAEQADAVQKTKAYFESHKDGEFLWNAKPRFGKTLAVYDLCKQMDLTNVLIVTNRPAIANSWYSDYVKFLGRDSGYLFVSHVDALEGQPYVLNREEYIQAMLNDESLRGCIEFVSLQDLKGSVYFGGEHKKLDHIIHSDSGKPFCWDLLVVDEAHEGVDTYKTDIAFDRITRKQTLHLSGTPFKALANDKFPADAIYNWTYADEQQAKRDWQGEVGEMNPYAAMPKLNLFTYQMSEIISDELKRGVEIDGETEEYAFDLGEFFSVKAGVFAHEESVDRFLDALTKQEKFPFSTDELRAELKHTFWLLNRVDSAKALAKKLKEHPIFKDYEIVLAAGDGRLDESEETKRAYDKVVDAIKKHEKTITLSVGQLTTGVTIPEWSGVLMLSNMKSPALYMQAAFRSQNPWSYTERGQFYRKQNAYVFDFDPARTLMIFEQFANDLCASTADGRGDSTTRKEHVRTLLNFFPVIGEDEAGEMVELNAEQVLSIPRKIKSKEVVRRGFMSDFLFQNISNIFHAPQEVIDIIQRFEPMAEPKQNAEVGVTPSTGEELSLDENGEVSLDEGYVIGRSADVFGDKIYQDVQEQVYDAIDNLSSGGDALARVKQAAQASVITPVMERAKEEYGRDLRPSDQRRFEAKTKEEINQAVNRLFDNHQIEQKTREVQRQKALDNAHSEKERQQINSQFDAQQKKADTQLQNELLSAIDEKRKETQQEIIRTVETSRKEQEKKGYEDKVRDHLRGFSRTIPSFLMAYGSENVTLQTFDQIIPENVFSEVTSITLEQFRFLRDGGAYINPQTGEEEHFDGHLFDPIVFDDSVREFLRMKEKLANYFDETNTEDIFDYIPPQRTNQIFTPKRVVKQMVDLLEQENPGCFDDPDKTFIDLYMKSGLYIAEIVKRLYRNAKMKKLYPDGNERLRHIFEKQVYGLAPTEIIYQIAKNFILGFADDAAIITHNLRLLDALDYAKDGTLERNVEEVFGGK